MLPYLRYMMVCHASFMQGQENILNKAAQFSLLVSLSVGVAASYYREQNPIFLLCMGKSELLHFDLKTFNRVSRGFGIPLPFFNPFRLLVNVIIIMFVFLAPVLYHRIFKFRLKMDNKAPGKYIYNTTQSAPGALAHCLRSHTTCKIQNGHQEAQNWMTWVNPQVFGCSHQLLLNKFFYSSTHSLRTIHREHGNSGHYIVFSRPLNRDLSQRMASSLIRFCHLTGKQLRA